MAAAAAILSLVGNVISNKGKQQDAANATLDTLEKEAETLRKEAKTWKTVFFASVAVAVILIVVLVLMRRR